MVGWLVGWLGKGRKVSLGWLVGWVRQRKVGWIRLGLGRGK